MPANLSSMVKSRSLGHYLHAITRIVRDYSGFDGYGLFTHDLPICDLSYLYICH